MHAQVRERECLAVRPRLRPAPARSDAPFRYCCEVFDYLALAAIVDGSVFCVHGGLSPNVNLIDHVRTGCLKDKVQG